MSRSEGGKDSPADADRLAPVRPRLQMGLYAIPQHEVVRGRDPDIAVNPPWHIIEGDG